VAQLQEPFACQLLVGGQHGVARQAKLSRQEAGGGQADARPHPTIQHGLAELPVELLEQRSRPSALKVEGQQGADTGFTRHTQKVSVNLVSLILRFWRFQWN